jgi:hypothetical protein
MKALRNHPGLVATLIAAGAFFSLGGATRAQDANERQAQCELSAIRDTRSLLAVQSIRSACNWLALNADSLLNERNMKYYVCLVQNLSGAQSDVAAQAIVSACRASNPL